MSGRRNTEFFGLVLVAAIFIGGLALARGAQEKNLVLPAAWLWAVPAVLAAVHLVLRYRAPGADPLVLPLAGFLTVLGLIELDSLGTSFTNQQIWVGVGLVALTAVIVFIRDAERLGELKYLAGLTGIALLLAPIFFGTVRGGSKLWLVLGGYSFQPSELAKIFLTVFLAAYLAENKEVLAAGRYKIFGLTWPEVRHFGPLVLTWLLSLVILVLERDLGSSLIFFSLFLVLTYISTGRFAYVVVGLSLFLAGTFLAYHVFSHVAARIDVWLQPLPDDISGSAYQVAQSLFALSAGGMSGTGLGAGLLGRQISMPAVHTDFIFSVLAEELGLAGTAAVVLSYMLFLARGFHISLRAGSDFTRLLAAGLATVTAVQAIVIIAGVIKLIPLTGVTLPFVSYGGSSMVSSFIVAGLLLSISKGENG